MRIPLVLIAWLIFLIIFGLVTSYICINTGLANKKEEERKLNNGE